VAIRPFVTCSPTIAVCGGHLLAHRRFYVAMYRAMARPRTRRCRGHQRRSWLPHADPDLARRYPGVRFPWYRQLVAAIHDAGKPCILHSCGQLDAIMNELIADCGIDAKPLVRGRHSAGRRGQAALRRPDRDPGRFDVDRLCRSTPDAIRRQARHLVTDLGRQGGTRWVPGIGSRPLCPSIIT